MMDDSGTGIVLIDFMARHGLHDTLGYTLTSSPRPTIQKKTAKRKKPSKSSPPGS